MNHSIKATIEKLKNRLETEIFTNLDDYKKFSKSDVDIKQELQQFLQNHERYYMNETGDLFLHAI